MKSNRTVPERLLAMALCLVLFIGMLSEGISTAYAEEAGTVTASYGSVSVTESALSVENNGTESVSVKNTGVATLNWVADNGTRGSDGWWMGMKVTAPSELSVEELKSVKYTVGGTEKSFWDHRDSQGEDGEQYIWLYGLITLDYLENDDDGVLNYIWTFNWNEDSVQSFTLSISASNLVLLNEEGVRVYPSVYGTLSSSYGGIVTGEDTNETALTVSGVNVPYDTANKAWRMDVTVTAPAHVAETKEGENEFTSPTTYYLVLNPDDDNYTVDGELSSTFYWDGVEQKMSLVAEDVTLIKAQQPALTFETAAPVDQYLTTGGFPPQYGSYTNKATGGSGGKINYESSDTDIATVDSNGKVTFKNVGTVTITATCAGDAYYEDAEASYNLTIVNRNWNLRFTYSNPDDFVYGTGGNVFSNAATYANGQTSGITYSSSDSSVATVDNYGNVTILKTGIVKITATKKEGVGYRDEEISYTLTIVQGNQSIEIDGDEVILYNTDEDYRYTYAVSGITSSGVTTVSSSNEAVATVELNADQNVVVTPVAVGSFTLTISNEGDENYKGGEATKTITVLLEESTAAFEKSGNQVVTYNDNGNVFTNALTGIQGSAENITYSSSNPDVATVDGNGKVTILKAGETIISANKAADGAYGPVELSYKLTINKASQTIAFVDTTPFVKVGTQNYQQSATETSTLFGNGEITYSVVNADLEYKQKSFKTETGYFELKPNKSGTITIQATKAADDCYNEATAAYTLTVGYEKTPDPAYTLSEATGENGWYVGDVIIYPVEGYNISYSSDFPNSNWSDSVQYNTEGKHSPVVYLRNTETKGITAAVTVEELKIDTACPTNLSISYSDDVWGKVLEKIFFRYYNARMTVTIHAEDATSGVAKIYYNYSGEWFSAAPDANGNISFTIDPEYKGRIQYYAVDNAGLKTDTITDGMTLIIDSLKPGINVAWSDAATVCSDNTRYYSSEAVATVVITETNFFNGEDVKIDGGKFDGDWTAVTDEAGNEIQDTWVNTVTLNEEGDHIVTISYSDRSKNPMEGDRTDEGKYTSPKIVIDKTKPVIILPEGLNGTCTNQILSTQITVVERNFNASRVTVTLKGESPAIEEHEVEVVWSEAKNDRNETVADTYVATLTIPGDSIYTLSVQISDPVEKSNSSNATFTVEMTDPTNLEISYSDDVLGQVLEAVTFGYYNAQMTVTIHAEDATSGVANIYYNCHYNYSGEWPSAAPDANGDISFKIDPEYRGNVQYKAEDNAGNVTGIVSGQTTIIVDTIEPGINVSWSDAVTVSSDNIRYYANKAVATVIITETNFFNGEDVEINGGKFDGDWTAATDEDGNEIQDTWVNTVTLNEEGDHIVTISYSDRSKNPMEGDRTDNGVYTSPKIVIDKTDPVIRASIDTGTTRQYYNQTQTITITVTEKNFDASLVEIDVIAVDSAGTATNGNVSYGEWIDKGNDVHTIDVIFHGDANYTLSANCKDLAGRSATLDGQLFTVDKTAPTSMTITYSNSVLSQILSGITFSYYNAPVTVSISAIDATAGIDSFSYQYILNNGVSSVNKGGSGTVTATQNGNTYTASFQVPAGVLTATNQFNGYITFTAVDRANNTNTETHQGSHTVVVDNISPTSTVTYNAPYQEVNDVSYYAGNIEATIAINEANFDSGDVVVTVTKDGAVHTVDVAWVNNSADNHTGTFTLTEDGDYTVSISYKDKSGNQMADYTSGLLALDTTAPTIRVSNIVANSANKDAEYGFVITIDDTNLDATSMKPVLTAVVQNEKGLYTVMEVDLGEPVTVIDGQTYTYTVENLTRDALYTLSCEVMDMAGNITNTATLDDGKEYDEIKFSINRNGSTFDFGDDYIESVVSKYYVYEVYHDIVIVEINVDPIENYVVMLNGKELTEGVDYTTEQTSNPGEWSKRTYVVSKKLFAAEGEYSVVVSSKDKAQTTAYSDVKNLSVAFVVDQTAPVLTISGLETGGRYQTDEQNVTVIPTDEGGCLYSMKILALDSRGKAVTDDAGNDISVRFEMSGEDFLKYLEENDGKVTFTIPEGLNQQIQVVCNDCAEKADGTTNEYNNTFKKVTVSQNQLVIFYANTPLFVGTIVCALAFILILVMLFKRKKDKKETK